MEKYIHYFIIGFILSACSPATTDITGSWESVKANLAAEKINSILVTALTSKTNARQTVENDLALMLEKDGYKAIKSIDILPPTFSDGEKPNKEALFSKINETGADAILTVALIDKETETRYVPGNASYAPIPRFGYYGTFWGYYNTWYPRIYSPGYYTEDKIYFIETNLYDARTEELLWSAQSETYNPGSLTDFSRDFSEVVLTEMEKDGVLKNKS